MGVTMTFKEIQRRIKKKDYLFSDHADEERTKDNLTAQEVEKVVLSGRVIEERLDDPRGESRLIAGKTNDGRLVHVVIGLRFGKPVIVTNYIPSQVEWIGGTIRKR
ncbi:MAG: DUF4258 domain-containing protein [Candidatus Daviesbacteria bacterium]|nr:DUF4258 domain-containing protein [Candidatus Daviesbacteria bacterium]